MGALTDGCEFLFAFVGAEDPKKEAGRGPAPGPGPGLRAPKTPCSGPRARAPGPRAPAPGPKAQRTGPRAPRPGVPGLGPPCVGVGGAKFIRVAPPISNVEQTELGSRAGVMAGPPAIQKSLRQRKYTRAPPRLTPKLVVTVGQRSNSGYINPPEPARV